MRAYEGDNNERSHEKAWKVVYEFSVELSESVVEWEGNNEKKEM